MRMRGVYAAALTLCLLAVSGGAVAQQTPEPRIGIEGVPNAPIYQGEKPEWAEFTNPYADDLGNLAKANRTMDEITEWAGGAISNTLTFKVAPDQAALAAAFEESKPYFELSGWKGYVKFLQASKIYEAVKGGTYSVMTIANGSPFILSSGVESDRWQWTVSMPVVISVIDPLGDKDGTARSVWTNKTSVKIVISRVAQGGKNNMAIVKWEEMPG